MTSAGTAQDSRAGQGMGYDSIDIRQPQPKLLALTGLAWLRLRFVNIKIRT